MVDCNDYNFEEIRFVIEKALVRADAQTINWRTGDRAATLIRLDADKIMLANHSGVSATGIDPLATYADIRFEFEQALLEGYYQASNWDTDKDFFIDKASRFSAQLMSILYPSKTPTTDEPEGPALEDRTLVEIWQVTPIVDIAGITLLWTFVPLIPGQVSLLFSHAAGVLTYLPICVSTVNITFTEESEMNLSANNEDVIWSYVSTYVGSGVSILPDIVDSFAHARSGIYFRSGQVAGIVRLSEGDTLQWDGTAVGTGLSTVDLNSGFLVFSVNL